MFFCSSNYSNYTWQTACLLSGHFTVCGSL